jgi:energy-coupling factor transporter ATP-binding protein EcfA2
MLNRLYVDNFRCLSNFELKTGRVTTLVGPNGAGKSSVFDVLLALQGLLSLGEEIKTCFPPWSGTRWDKRLNQRFELDVVLDGRPYSYVLEVAQTAKDGGNPSIHDERLAAEGKTLYRLNAGEVQLFGDNPTAAPPTTFPFSSRRSFLPLLEERPDNRLIFAFRRWLERLSLFRLNPQAIAPISPAESRTIHMTGADFVSWYRTLVQESPEAIIRVVDDLRPVIPGLARFRLVTLGLTHKALYVECMLSGERFDLSLNELSDGQRALLVLYSLRHALPAYASLLVLDEPDNFVAQAEIQPWLSSLREGVVELGRSNLLVISHHPEVIDYLAPDEVLVLARESGGATRIRELMVDRDQGLTASEALRRGPGDGE